MEIKKSYSIELSPVEWIIDQPVRPIVAVRNNSTGELVPDACIFIAGGNLNLFYQTDENGKIKPPPRAPHGHKMMGTTPVYALIKASNDSEDEEEKLIGPGKFSNIEHQKNWGKNKLELPDPMHVGKEYSFAYKGEANWHKILYQELVIEQDAPKKVLFDLDDNVKSLHLILRWWNFKHSLSFEWLSPNGKTKGECKRITVKNKNDPDQIIDFPLMQPKDNGIISEPVAGSWTINISRVDKLAGPCNATLEAYTFYDKLQPIRNIVIQIVGAGLNIEKKLNTITYGNYIRFTPSKVGKLYIISESTGSLSSVCHAYDVIQ
jgi:hypothetical protein